MFGLIWSFFVWAIPYVALYAGLHYLGGVLQGDIPEVDASASDPQSSSWDPHTTQTEGVPRVRAYGKNLHTGNIVAKWTDVTGTIPNQKEVLYLVVEHGDGPTKGIGAGLVYLNDQPVGNFPEVSVQERLGTMDQTCMTGFEKTKLEHTLKNSELQYNEPVLFTTPNDVFDDIELTLFCPNGLRKYRKDGSMKTAYVAVKVRIRENPAGGWSTVFDDYIIGESGGGFTVIYKKFTMSSLGFDCEYGKQYDIEVTRVQAPDSKVVNDVYFRSVREIVDTAFTRPGKALIGITAIATSRLSGSLNVKVIREDRLINVFNGTSWSIEYSRNRAWVDWDVLTQPVISGSDPYTIERYEGIDPSRLSLPFFYEWAQRCSEQVLDGYGGTEDQAACDIIIDFQTDVFTQAYEIAQVGRAHIYWRGHVLDGWVDAAVTEPMDLVTMNTMMTKTWRNVWAIKEELAGVVEVFYKNANEGYERMSVTFANKEAGSYKNPVIVEGVGITTHGTATHFANYMLERNRLIRNVNSFQVAKDGFRYKLGHVIRLQCKVANWGHGYRTISATVDTVTLDRDATSDVSAGDLLYVRSYDSEEAHVDVYTVESVNSNIITIEESNWEILPVKGDRVAIGVLGSIKSRRIIKITPTIDNYFDVVVETYDEDLFDADELDPDNPNANYIWPEPAGLIDRPITRAEITDLIRQLVPPQPDIEIPWPSNLTWTGDEVDTVNWESTTGSGIEDGITFRYRGETYEIEPDETTDEFIYWDPEYTTVFRTTNLASTALAPGCWLMCVNKDGVAYPANAVQLMHAGILLAGTIRAETYLELRNTYVYNGDDSLDNSKPLEVPFKIVSEMIDIRSVKLSFRLMSYRAYSTAAASGGGSTSGLDGIVMTGYDGPGSTQYDGSGGSGSATPGTNSTGAGQTGYSDGPGSHFHYITGGSHSHTVNSHQHSTPSHSHSITNHSHTVGFHTHSTPNHAHGVTYGIHEESNSPTVHYHVDNGAGFGAPSGNYTTSQLDLVITGLISGSGWKAIRFDTNLRCRISAIIECKLDIDA